MSVVVGGNQEGKHYFRKWFAKTPQPTKQQLLELYASTASRKHRDHLSNVMLASKVLPYVMWFRAQLNALQVPAVVSSESNPLTDIDGAMQGVSGWFALSEVAIAMFGVADRVWWGDGTYVAQRSRSSGMWSKLQWSNLSTQLGYTFPLFTQRACVFAIQELRKHCTTMQWWCAQDAVAEGIADVRRAYLNSLRGRISNLLDFLNQDISKNWGVDTPRAQA